ncbi:MAG TPA: hypothetical protein VFQ61_24550, partial [Polyangiaceae bacterium]|nr:hypothetical protein [Polyangiaceae bacterium]
MKQLFPLFVLAAAVSSGCAASTELDGEQLGADDSVGDVEQAFTEAACPTLTPDRLISVVGHNKSATARSSGTNYGTDTRCPRAFRVDVQAINAATASVYVYWQSPFPQSK